MQTLADKNSHELQIDNLLSFKIASANRCLTLLIKDILYSTQLSERDTETYDQSGIILN